MSLPVRPSVSKAARDPASLDAALLAAALLPLAFFACVAWFSYRNAVAEVHAAVDSRVDLLLGHTAQLIQVNALLLDRLRERFDRFDTREIHAAERRHHEYLARLRERHPDVLGMAVIGRDGVGVAHSHLFPIPPVSAADRDYVAAHRENPDVGLFISQPLQSRLVNEPGFVLSIRRGRPDQRFDGVYTASIRSKYIFEFWEQVARRAPRDETMSLIRADGTILVRFPERGPDAPLRLAPDSPLMRFIATGQTAGSWDTRSSVDGTRRVFATRKLEDLPLYVNFGVNTDIALASWRRDVYLMGAVALAASAALLALSLLVRRRNRSLREAARQKDEFLAALSHELRNPLSAIMLGTELLERSREEGARRQALQVIGRQLEQLRRLVDDLLDTARATYDKLVLERRPVDLLGAAQGVAQSHRQRAGSRAQIEVSGTQVWADADPARLQQMIENLVDNAVKYGGTRVLVEVAASGEAAEVSVADNGEGVSAELLPRLFQPFMQGEQPLDRSRGGLGLGLALVHRLAVLHGGSIRAESEGRGKGSRFTLRLPLAAAPAAVEPAAAPAAVVPRRVLIVEDQPDARESLRALLRLDGHEVIMAKDGGEGLECLRTLRPDVALIDIGLPGIDGFELARLARAHGHRNGVKLVALSGYTLEADRRKARDAGFDLHLAKPVSYAELAEALR